MSNPPSVKVEFNKKASADLREIADYLLNIIGPDQTAKVFQQVSARFNYLAENPWIGDTVEGFNESIRRWYTKDKKYQIFFRRTGKNKIRVLRVYRSNRRPLTSKDL